jgi:anti-sigma regulatory factor (Ser/Thr protein kinase)
MPKNLDTGPEVLVDLRLSPDRTSPGLARRALQRWAERYDPDTAFKLGLLVTELVTNSVKHGRLEGGDHIGVRLIAERDSLRVEVRDPGPGPPTPRRTSPETGWAYLQEEPDPEWPGGWGLSIVERLADRWGVVRDEVTKVWFEVSVAPLAGGVR